MEIFKAIGEFWATGDWEYVRPFLSEAVANAIRHNLLVWAVIIFVIERRFSKIVKTKMTELSASVTTAKEEIAKAVVDAKNEFKTEIVGVRKSIEELAGTIKKVETTHSTENSETNRRLDRQGEEIKELRHTVKIFDNLYNRIMTLVTSLKTGVDKNIPSINDSETQEV